MAEQAMQDYRAKAARRILMCVVIGCSGLAWSAPRKALLYGADGSWCLLKRPSRQCQVFHLPVGYETEEISVSPDGTTVAFAFKFEGEKHSAIFLWKIGSAEPPFRFEAGQGRHGDPKFNHTGKRLYFSHAPGLDGLPGKHKSKQTAQIYAVDLDTLKSEQLTNEQGCHLQPQAPEGGIYMTRTNCRGRYSVAKIAQNDHTTAVLEGFGKISELAVSDDSRHLALVVKKQVGKRLVVVRAQDGSEVVQIDLPGAGKFVRPQFSGKSSEVIYQLRNQIHSTTQPTVIEF